MTAHCYLQNSHSFHKPGREDDDDDGGTESSPVSTLIPASSATATGGTLAVTSVEGSDEATGVHVSVEASIIITSSLYSSSTSSSSMTVPSSWRQTATGFEIPSFCLPDTNKMRQDTS